MERLGGKGLRVMAAAMRDLDPAGFDPEGDLLSLVTDLQMTAIVGMIDPPRAESMDAVKAAQDANIRVRMVTGDDVVTGAAVAKQLGIPGEAILGTELAAMSEEERLARIDNIGVVGRVAPEHKVLMVETLRKKGDVVAMTGDGVNDAPAIKAADIGIAMGSGTQVAKNAGKMILTDDNFATIVRAVSEGRKLYDNMLKYIRFMLVALVTYVVTFLMASILNIAGGEPFSAVQILWINFLITAPVGIALGLDKETPGLMKRLPRPRSAKIMTPSVITTVGLAGCSWPVAINLVIVYGENTYGTGEIGSTMGLVAFSLMLVIAAFESRDERGHGPARRDVRQSHPEHHRPGGDRAGCHDRPRRGPDLAARRRRPDRQPVADRCRTRRGAADPVGARQGHRSLTIRAARRRAPSPRPRAPESDNTVNCEMGAPHDGQEGEEGREDRRDRPCHLWQATTAPKAKMKTKEYETEMRRLQGELVALQDWVVTTGAKVCIVFEGLDSAGKGGTIRRITERTSPRVFKHIALPTPTEREKSQMYVQRYIAHFPSAGEVAIFDRSWYNRAGVEPVMGYCTPEQTEKFLAMTPLVEKAMVDNGIILLKYWLNVSVEEQTRRLANRITDPVKTWKLSPTDLKSYSRHYDYCRARDAMLAATDTVWAPWFVVDNNDKKRARLNIISHLLSQIPYTAPPAVEITMPRKPTPRGYVQPDQTRNHIPTPY